MFEHMISPAKADFIVFSYMVAGMALVAAVLVVVIGLKKLKKWEEQNEIERKQVWEMAQGGHPFLRAADDPGLDDGADSNLDDYGNDGGAE